MRDQQGINVIRSATLRDWVGDYQLRRGVSDGAAYQLRRTVALFDEYLARCALGRDLEDVTVSKWIEWLASRGYAARTMAGHRANLLMLWRHVAEVAGIPWPGRIRRTPIPVPQPVAWTMEELAAIRSAACTVPGKLSNGVARGLYFGTLVDTAYESGLRRSDLWRLKQSDFLETGVIIIRQHKTGMPHEPQVSLETLARVRLLPPAPLAWPGDASGFYPMWYRWVICRARVRPGALQQIRRSGATQMEIDDPNETSRYLGHLTPHMKRNYVDRSQAMRPARRPPMIER